MMIVNNGKATIKIAPISRRIIRHVYLQFESGLSLSLANFIVMHKQIRPIFGADQVMSNFRGNNSRIIGDF